MDSLIIVHSGESWSHQLPPCSRSMVRFLERNEEVVTWVQVCFAVSWRLAASGGDRSVWQPRDGRVEDQFPVIKMNGLYFSMSLRMMKAVWFVPRAGLAGTAKTEPRARVGRRNVRLKKGFVNVERAPFGGVKLRIPTLLFAEKMRTQSRFNVSHFAVCLRGSRLATRDACIKTRTGGPSSCAWRPLSSRIPPVRRSKMQRSGNPCTTPRPR